MQTPCTQCNTLHPQQFVPGEGLKTPGTLMFIGEAPGAEEVEATPPRPFIGGAGRLLRYAIFKHAGMHDYEVYITNVLKCRPPNNRTPLIPEIQACLPRLIEEIQMIQPRMIVALGLTAAETLTGKNLTWRGLITPCWLKDLTHVPVLITFHPAYLLREGREHLTTIVHDLTKIDNPPPVYEQKYLVNPPLDAALQLAEHWITTKCNIAVDIETVDVKGQGGGLNPFTDNIAGIAFCGQPGIAFHFSFTGSERAARIQLTKEILECLVEKTLQNNTFDRVFLRVREGISVKDVTWDTMDAAHIIYPDFPKKLQFLRSLYTTVHPYKTAQSGKTKAVTGWENCADADVTLRVAVEQRKYIHPPQTQALTRLLKADDVAINMRVRGVGVDKTRIATNLLKLQPYVKEAEQLFFEKYYLNPGSPKQVANFLFNTRKLPAPRSARTKTGFSVDEEVLEELLTKVYIQEDRVILTQILQYRKVAKLLSTYVEGVYRLIQADGRIHPDWKPIGTDTGRWSCLEPNLQNQPKKVLKLPNGVIVNIRDQYKPAPGKKYLVADYKQLELVTGAILAQEYQLVEDVLNGVDVHEQTRQEIQAATPGISISRNDAKGVVFGTMYGMQATTAARAYNVPVNIVLKWQEVCFYKYPKLAAFAKANAAYFEQHGYIEDYWGRRKYCTGVNQALNKPVQGTAAGIMENALFKLDDEGWSPIITVHDELICEVPEATSIEGFKQIIQHSSSQLHHTFLATFHEGQNWVEEKE